LKVKDRRQFYGGALAALFALHIVGRPHQQRVLDAEQIVGDVLLRRMFKATHHIGVVGVKIIFIPCAVLGGDANGISVLQQYSAKIFAHCARGFLVGVLRRHDRAISSTASP
jgi:hypothetical protein